MIPERDIRILQQRAFDLYFNGKGQIEVKQMLKEAGGNEHEIESLATKFADDLKFFHQEQDRIAKKDAPIQKIVGGILLFGGLFLSLSTYIIYEKTVVIFYGAILVGGIMFIRAILAENNKI
jgi:hypothetical protein